MKKVLGVFMLLVSLTGCDDGDMVFENLNFDGKAIQKCTENELYFKINDRELLLVDFSFGKTGSQLDSLAPLNTLKSFTTNNTNKIVYRTYDGAVNATNLCSILPPANPKVTSEYTSVNGGIINYTRTMNPAVTEGVVNVTYMYTINFENITLSNGSSEIKYTTFPFGSYIYESNRLTFNFANFDFCDNSILNCKTINEIFQIPFPENFSFPTKKETQTINFDSANPARYLLFRKNFTTDSCELPDIPIKEDWLSGNGSLSIESVPVTNPSGQVTGYRHTLKIIQAQFKKDNFNFVITDKTIGVYQVEL